MMCLKGAWEKHDHFFITWDMRPGAVTERAHFIEQTTGVLPMIVSGLKLFPVLVRERPNVILSTGAGWMDLFAFFFAKLLRIKTVYVESVSRTETCTGTGNAARIFADEFLVQWPEMERTCGRKAKYRGGII